MVRELDGHFGEYSVLKALPRQEQANLLLRKAAAMVKPIMRKRGWRVSSLEEFLPPEENLLGLNVNRTERILIRLRYNRDPSCFRGWGDIIDTLLHELSHIVWGPHDENFNRLWNELRDEHTSLVRKGYSGEGFLSKGHRLGGARVPVDELRRRARQAAETRAKTPSGGGHRVGGKLVRGTDMRKVIADAATRRTSSVITDGCASGTKEADRLAEQARRNGFRSKAEEDDANNLAIANALIELMEEEEERKIAGWNHPADEGLQWTPENGLDFAQPAPTPRSTSSKSVPPAPKSTSSRSAPPPPIHSKPASTPPQPKKAPSIASSSSRPSRPVSRLVAEDEARRKASLVAESESRKKAKQAPNPYAARPSAFVAAGPSPNGPPTTTNNSTRNSTSSGISSLSSNGNSNGIGSASWSCAVCTLHNPLENLNCEACGSEMPVLSPVSEAKPRSPMSNSNSNPRTSGLTAARVSSIGWKCHVCMETMEDEYWSCRFCGTMKAES